METLNTLVGEPNLENGAGAARAGEPLSWNDLEALLPPELAPAARAGASGADPGDGPTSAQSLLRLFGQPESAVRVTLYRDHHAWCPYCQKVWLWLEERRIPYRVRKVTMFCYGEKEGWYVRLVPSGMLPALELDGRLITESDRILEALEASFGSLGPGMHDSAVLPLRRLERELFRAWCEWLCYPHHPASDARARDRFRQLAGALERELERRPGAFLLGDQPGTADLVFVPYVERMNASLAYYKGFLLRREHPALDRWFRGLEQRSTYLGTQSDFHTHAHDLPPQMGGCHANGSEEQRALARRIDHGPWPILEENGHDPETSQPPPATAAGVALARVLRHRATLLARNPLGGEGFDLPLRCALTRLITGVAIPPPAGSAAGLRHLRDRISVPRDMPLHAARLLRTALERSAHLDPLTPEAQGAPLPLRHRRDQDPQPFLANPGPADQPASGAG
jgi:glutathione S-transferase